MSSKLCLAGVMVGVMGGAMGKPQQTVRWAAYENGAEIGRLVLPGAGGQRWVQRPTPGEVLSVATERPS